MSNNTTQINRHLFLSDEVSPNTVKVLIEKIHEINRFDDKREKETYNNYNRNSSPITLTINTPGGVVTSGLALIDTIKTSKTPIHGVGLGMIASMGIPILLSCHKRSAHEHAIFMIHDIAYGQGGTYVEHERRMEMINKFLRTKVHKIILDNTHIRQEELMENDERVKDWYFDTDEAIKLGVVSSKVVITRLKKEDVQAGNFVVEE